MPILFEANSADVEGASKAYVKDDMTVVDSAANQKLPRQCCHVLINNHLSISVTILSGKCQV